MRGCQEWPVCDGFHGGGCHCGGGGCHGGGGGFESLSLFEARANRSYPQTPITFIKCILQSKIDKLTFTPITFTFIMDLPISQNMNMALTLKNMTTLWVLIYSCLVCMWWLVFDTLATIGTREKKRPMPKGWRMEESSFFRFWLIFLWY